MHHLVIGAFVFAVGENTPIAKFDRTTQGAYSQVALVNNARSEFVGRPLETIHITAKWLQFGADDNVQTLRSMIDSPQQVSTGTGQNLGRWTIKQLREGRSQLIHNGQAMVTDVQLELEEYRQ
ncbi:phage tail protein [Celerinatantimonas sp. MCCC 1A17872]|uniref:phage tail protein n=1 Tax=Celerinatantimonas sp. MCCC 1A17872 TaxID=3177514 RepID=UPI0038C38B33